MLEYCGHPLLDVGIATLAAFAGKVDPATLTQADLDAAADYMERNYVVDPLKSFLTVAFPNSGFTQPAYASQPEKRAAYSRRVLRAFRAGTPIMQEPCAFTGRPSVAVTLDVTGGLPPGRAYRQHVPLVTGEGVINFHPYGDAGLPVSGEALLAFQALPLGCAKIMGRLLAVHSDNGTLMYEYARRFLERNRQAVLTSQAAGEKKMAEYPHKACTAVVEILLDIEGRRLEETSSQVPSVTAYHFSNLGQKVALDIYYLPLEVGAFIRAAVTPRYRGAWEALCLRGWEVASAKKAKDADSFTPSYNVLYEDLFRLPTEAASFIRRYFLRRPKRHSWPGDPRTEYSIQEDVGLITWELTDLFLRKVVLMNSQRIEQVRALADRLAAYVKQENDARFFRSLLMAARYDHLRAALIRASVAEVRRGRPSLVDFDPYVAVFEEGSELPFSDWRLARDLVLIRMLEQLHQLGWLRSHAEDVPTPPAEDDVESANEMGG